MTGVVVDAETNVSISGATIELGGNPAAAVSDEEGHFRISHVAGNRHRVPQSWQPGLDTNVGVGNSRSKRAHKAWTSFSACYPRRSVYVTSIFKVKPPRVSSPTSQGFNRRRDKLPGHFFTRADIERIGAQRLTEVVRRVPGLDRL